MLTPRIPARRTSAPARTTATSPPPSRRPTSDPLRATQLDASDTDDTPMPGLHIPNIRTASSESWKDIVRHWVSGAPELGLDTPLKEWTTGANRRKFAMKYHNRPIIAVYVSDEARFLEPTPRQSEESPRSSGPSTRHGSRVARASGGRGDHSFGCLLNVHLRLRPSSSWPTPMLSTQSDIVVLQASSSGGPSRGSPGPLD
ncbi:hypothetical protein HD554DRAFT_1764760 [Boletus coccyginus]|nr:hypothetical protein HD554DRAFT_1764760 [Boletus coccyginus]